MTKKELDDFVDVLRFKRAPFLCGNEKHFYVNSIKVDREGTWDHELICKKNEKYICDPDNDHYLIIDSGVFVFDSNVEFSIEKDQNDDEFLIFKAKDPKQSARVSYYENSGKLATIDKRLKQGCGYSFDISKCKGIKFENYEIDYSRLNYVNKDKKKPEDIESDTRFLTYKIALDNEVECGFVTSSEPRVWNWTY